MRYFLIGGGFTNTVLALLIKKVFKDADVFIVEKNEDILKKLSITGNGKCNILNKQIKEGLIITDTNISQIFDKFKYKDLEKFYIDLGLPLFEKGDYVYPYSESANQVKDLFKRRLDEAKVNILLNECVLDYKKINDNYIISTNKNNYECDYIVFATGGKSYPALGADDSILSNLKNNHNYKVKNFKPALCAIKVKENVKVLDGVRARAKITILDGNKEVFVESGEILFKKDGLSGIVIFNASLYISKHYEDYKNVKISLNLLENINIDINDILKKYAGSAEFLNSYLGKKLANYIYKIVGDNLSKAFNFTQNMLFRVASLYSFEYAQISVGGIELDNLSNYLESKHENNVFFGGELIDISGYCGGFNLSACLISALIIFSKLTSK